MRGLFRWLVLLAPLVLVGAQVEADYVTRFETSEYHEDDDLATFDGRLSKRSVQDTRTQLYLEFEGLGKRFGLVLEPHDSLVVEDSVVRVHRNGSIEESGLDGNAFVGRRLLVVDSGSPADLAVMIKKTEAEAPFAHFYIDRKPDGKMDVQGGFTHEGSFYQVNHAGHPRKPGPTKQAATADLDRLVVSAQPAHMMSGFGEERDEAGAVTKRYKCGHDLNPWNVAPDGAEGYFFRAREASHRNSTALAAESRLAAPAAYSTGCPLNRKTLLVGIVADCNYARAFQGNRGKIQTALLNEFSMVSAIYEKAFNLNLGIMSIDVMADCDADEQSWNSACRPKHLLSQQMSKFSKYREGLRKDVGVYHLVTDCLHTEVVGIAWLNQVCRTNTFTSGNDHVSGTSASTLIRNHFSVIAHEIAHNLGAQHDCNRELCQMCDPAKKNSCDCCPCGLECDCKDKYIMSPGSGTIDVREFSPCTLKQVCSKIPILATCLVEPGSKKTLKLGQCGNGIREDDEECDCGSPEQCAKDPCCMEGCKLRPKATCSDANDPCCRKCSIIPASERHVCAKANGFCQFSSVCLGERECPQMRLRPNGVSCKEVLNGRCSAGVCTSRDAQCEAIGSQLGVKRACDTPFNGCDLVCKGPDGTCLHFKSTFSDGVACGMNGFCKEGVCSESIVVTAVTKYWLGLVVLGGMFLAALLFCLLASCRASI